MSSNERPAGAKLNQPQFINAPLHRASQSILVKADHSFRIGHPKHHVIDPLYGKGHNFIL